MLKGLKQQGNGEMMGWPRRTLSRKQLVPVIPSPPYQTVQGRHQLSRRLQTPEKGFLSSIFIEHS